MPRRTLLVVGVLLAVTASLMHLRTRLVVQRPLLPITFDHHDHGAVKCATCHHNFFDDTGRDACYFCHKRRPELAVTIEHDFHVFCRNCHTQMQAQGLASGPMRQCSGCHAAPD